MKASDYKARREAGRSPSVEEGELLEDEEHFLASSSSSSFGTAPDDGMRSPSLSRNSSSSDEVIVHPQATLLQPPRRKSRFRSLTPPDSADFLSLAVKRPLKQVILTDLKPHKSSSVPGTPSTAPPASDTLPQRTSSEIEIETTSAEEVEVPDLNVIPDNVEVVTLMPHRLSTVKRRRLALDWTSTSTTHSHSYSSMMPPVSTAAHALKDPTQTNSHIRYGGPMMPWVRDDYRQHTVEAHTTHASTVTTRLSLTDRLHCELVDFALYHNPTAAEHAERETMIADVRRVVATLWPTAHVEVFGSFKTLLYLPQSDLDFVILIHADACAHGLAGVSAEKCVCITGEDAEQRKMREVALLDELRGAFSADGLISFAEVISTARVPIIKMTDARFDVNIDMTLNRRSGLHSAVAIARIVSRYPVCLCLSSVVSLIIDMWC